MHDIVTFDRNREEEKQKMNEEMANLKTKVQVSLCSVFYYNMPLKQNFTFCSICVCSMQVVIFFAPEENLNQTLFLLQIVQAEKKGMALEIEDLKAEIRQMEAELKAVQKSHR